MSGVSPQDLAEADLIRELAHLHRTCGVPERGHGA
jgi:hypothetical protein